MPNQQDLSMTPVSNVVGDVLKGVCRRAELRPRLESEHGRTISDEEFVKIVEHTGLTI